MPAYMTRYGSVISLPPGAIQHPVSSTQYPTARLTYTAGYVLPGTTAQPGQTPLPPDLEQAAVEQVAFWFQNKDRLGLKTHWPSGDAYRQFATQDLLESVQAVLARYRRWSI
jgi:hypothetical protein